MERREPTFAPLPPQEPSDVTSAAGTRHRLLGLDQEAVTEWLLGLGLGSGAPLTFERVGNGLSNLMFLVVDADGSSLGAEATAAWDRRCPRPTMSTRERRILSALQPTARPDAGVLRLHRRPGGDRRAAPADGVRRRAGRRQRRGRRVGAARGSRAAWAARSLERSLGCTRSTSWRPGSTAWRRTSRTPPARSAAGAGSGSARARATCRRSTRSPIGLRRPSPSSGSCRLVHGDYHVLNVISSPSGDEIRAVLDWELCTLGDPLADLGGLLAYWPQAGDVGERARSQSRCSPGFPSRAELAQIYADETGRDLSALPFWHALGLWKIAIIGEGVRKRALDAGHRDRRGNSANGLPARSRCPGRDRRRRRRLLARTVPKGRP